MDIPNFIQMEIWKVCDNISGTAAFFVNIILHETALDIIFYSFTDIALPNKCSIS